MERERKFRIKAPSLMEKSKSCHEIAQLYFKDKNPKAITLEDRCIIDFTDPDILSELEASVDCDGLCDAKVGMEEEEAYSECVEECKEKIRLASRGSVVIDRETHQVLESTIPISCSKFYKTEDWERIWDPDKVEKYLDKFKRIDCKEASEGWMHAHEFVEMPVEVEEEPAICYLHITSEKNRGCRLSEVLRSL